MYAHVDRCWSFCGESRPMLCAHILSWRSLTLALKTRSSNWAKDEFMESSRFNCYPNTNVDPDSGPDFLDYDHGPMPNHHCTRIAYTYACTCACNNTPHTYTIHTQVPSSTQNHQARYYGKQRRFGGCELPALARRGPGLCFGFYAVKSNIYRVD